MEINKGLINLATITSPSEVVKGSNEALRFEIDESTSIFG